MAMLQRYYNAQNYQKQDNCNYRQNLCIQRPKYCDIFNSLNFCHLKGDQDDNASVSRGVGQRTLGQQLRGKGRGWRDVDLHNSIFSGIACAQSYLHSCTIACACVWQNHNFSFLVNAILATLVLVVIAI